MVLYQSVPGCTGVYFSLQPLWISWYKSFRLAVWVRRRGFCVKTNAEPLEPGSTVKTTVITRQQLPAAESAQAPDLFDYLQAIKPADWANHVIYVYRSDPPPQIPINKCGELFLCPDNTTVRLADLEELELALSRYYGGGRYRFIVKRGSQRVTQGNLQIGGPTKNIQPMDVTANDPRAPQSNSNTSMPTGESSTAAVAARGFDALVNQERQGAEIGFRAMQTAAEVMQRFATPQNGNGNESEIDRALKAAMIQRMLADPFDSILKFATVVIPLLKDMGILGGGGGGGQFADVLQKIAGVAVERALNPAPAGAPVSASAEMMRMLPTIGTAAVEGIREWRLGMEAQAKAIEISQRGPVAVNRPPAGSNPQVLPPVTANGQGQPQPNPAPGAQPVGELSVELVEHRIVDVLKANVPAADAAADIYHFIQVGQGPNGVFIAQLVSLGEAGLVQLFTTRPILQPMAKLNMPRTLEFIRAFLKYAAEEGTPPPGGTA